MKEYLYLAVFVTAVGTLRPGHSLKYHYVTEGRSWTEAQSYCRQNYTDLVTIESSQENDEVHKIIQANSRIGLFNKTWMWSLNNEALNQVYWRSNQPNNITGKDCVFMFNQTWNSSYCNETHPFICFNGKGNDKYIFVSTPSSWHQAQTHCRSNYTDLASVRKDTELNNLTKLISSNNVTDAVWIGLSRSMGWMWSDQRVFSFTKWSAGEPNTVGEACVEMYNLTVSNGVAETPGSWNDVSFGSPSPFVCYHDELFLIDKNMTWFEALAYCRRNYTDLVSVHTERIQHWVSRRAQQASSPYVWIGLRYTCTLDYWFWVSGNSTCYQNWAPNNGGGWEECGRTGAVQRDGEHQWFSMNEMEEFNFICSNSSDY